MNIDIDKLNEMKKEEFMAYAEEIPMMDEKISMPYVRVRQLLDFIQVLNKNLDIKPTSILTNYIILEIVSFYEILKKDYKFPKIPDYYDILKKIRGRIIGHLDKSDGLKKGKDWMKQYKKIDEIGIKKIIGDFYNIYQEFVKLKKENN